MLSTSKNSTCATRLWAMPYSKFLQHVSCVSLFSFSSLSISTTRLGLCLIYNTSLAQLYSHCLFSLSNTYWTALLIHTIKIISTATCLLHNQSVLGAVYSMPWFLINNFVSLTQTNFLQHILSTGTCLWCIALVVYLYYNLRHR